MMSVEKPTEESTEHLENVKDCVLDSTPNTRGKQSADSVPEATGEGAKPSFHRAAKNPDARGKRHADSVAEAMDQCAEDLSPGAIANDTVDSVLKTTDADSTCSDTGAKKRKGKKKLPIPSLRPHECHICHRTLCNRQTLKMHMHTHSGEKPYSCPFCPLRFTNPTGMYVHKRKHTGERPFTCEVCGRKFAQWIGRQTHMTTHTGEKAFKCSVCEKTFARRDTLQLHLRIHTGERPYQCSLCPKAYRKREAFQYHMSRQHKGES